MDIINDTSIQISNVILQKLAAIDEFKGSWKWWSKIAPDKLQQLQKIATIESIGSSTRIEGSKLTDKQVEQLLNNLELQYFSSRDEQEVAGYANVMELIFAQYESIPFTENYIKQLHQLLLQYSTKDEWHKGEYKKNNNHVEAFDTMGKSVGIVFETATPFETPIQMQQLLAWCNKHFEEKSLHPLIVIAVFNVWFLAIHPFQDGNGRLSRIIKNYLLLKNGYTYIPYASLEAIIEVHKKDYYLALRQTQNTLKKEHPNWEPWFFFFFTTLELQKERLLEKLELENKLQQQLSPLSQQIVILIKERGKLTVQEIVLLTNANRNTIKKQLQQLVLKQLITKNGIGKGTWYST